MAHVLELPNKLRLEGPLWLAVQQQIYNGWGPLIGAPTEIGGMVISLVLLAANRRRARAALLFGLASVAYGSMLLSFFLFNAPVNKAVNKWTPETLAADWATYRLRWEIGHALAALFGLLGLVAVASATLKTRTSDHDGKPDSF
jgi:peptidoglycan/LPS O-acetylase OafA/YrhL